MSVIPLRKEQKRARTAFEDVIDVFEYWRIVCSHEKARLDTKREQVIRERLADGYSVEDLRLAIEGCALSPFHQGQNDRRTVYDSVSLILRDADHVDRFMDIGQRARDRVAAMQQAASADAPVYTSPEKAHAYLAQARRLLKPGVR